MIHKVHLQKQIHEFKTLKYCYVYLYCMSQIFFYSYGKVKMTKNHFILHFHNNQVIARITMFPLWSRLTCACMYCPVSCIIGWCKSLVRFNFFWRLLWLGPLHLALRSANTVVWLKWIRKICDISAAGLNTHSVQCPHHQLSDDDFQTVLAGRLFCYYIPQLAAGRPLHSLYYCSWILYGFFWWLFDCHCYHRIWVCSSWNLAMVDK